MLDLFVAGSIFAPCGVGFVRASLAVPQLVARWGNKVIVAGATLFASRLASSLSPTLTRQL
ncbi:hypothetical protein [Castellaniella sp.]|uniref:hypothetical protein n=1 Tax=Castellaniella sp. TaxID=1955812 RepID=UPI002AFE0863|nr:hypothetical protein [Castellaniella sp.]